MNISRKPGEPIPVTVINVKELDKIAADIKESKGTPNYDVLLAKYTGPDVGVLYNTDTEEISIHSGWHANADGYIVRN